MKYLLLSAATVAIVLSALTLWRVHLTPIARRIAAGVMIVLVPVALRPVVLMVRPLLHAPPMWDVRCFWVWGRVALTDHAIYSAASSLSLGHMFPYNVEWLKEFLVVGFIYPPPTILLFAPLGLFPTPQAAAPYWYGANLLALAAAIVVLWRTFLRRYGWLGLLATAILVCSFRATSAAFMYGQPLPILLLLLALYLADKSPARRGIWLGLAFIVKPMAIAFFILPVLRRTWSEFNAGVATIAAGFAGAIALVGWKNVAPYFFNGPTHRYPVSIWMEQGNESLFSAVIRYTHGTVPSSLAHAELFLLSAAAVSIVTLYLCIRAGAQDREVTLSFLIAYALLVFPPSAGYYNDLLLIPLLVLFVRYAEQLPIVVIAYAVIFYELWTPIAFFAPLSLWLVYTFIMVRQAADLRRGYLFVSSHAR